MATLYADLSHHDWDRVKGEFDWPAIRKATSPVLCLRATYGDPAGYNPTTRHFADMDRGARSAGFDTIGGYHNLIRGDQASINRQVDYLRRTLDGAGATWAMLDVERYPELVDNGLWPRFDDVKQFADRWHAVDKRTLAVYLPRWIWSGHLGSPDLRVLGCPLVASDYGSNPDGSPAGAYAARGGDSGRGWTAYGGVTPAIWQYSSDVDCPGASGKTDCNAYRGTLAQLRALLTGEDDDMDEQQARQATRNELTLGSLTQGLEETPLLPMDDGTRKAFPVVPNVKLRELGEKVDALTAAVAELRARPSADVDEQALADALAPLLPGVSVEQVREVVASVLTSVRLVPQT